MMRSIVYQLIKDDTLYNVFLDLYREKRRIYGKGRFQWQQSELEKFVQSITKEPPPQSKPLLFLVDALDECDEKEVRDVVGFLETLSINASRANVELRICLSSRHYPRVSIQSLELTVEKNHGHDMDMTAYVKQKLYIKSIHIKNQILEKADGIFLWVVLVVAMLNKACDDGRVEDVPNILNGVLKDLEGLFLTLLDKGDSDKAELVSMVQWVLFSERVSTPKELYIATVGESLPSNDMIKRRIISSPKGLIEVRTSFNREFVQFIHLSVRDFLCRNRRLEKLDPTLEPDAISASQARLWASCWSYIKHLDPMCIWRGSLPFLEYATCYVFCHADKALPNDTVNEKLDRYIIQWLASRSHTPYRNLVQTVLAGGADINARCGTFGSALEAASLYQNIEMVKFLLERGAHIDAQSGKYGTALCAACCYRKYKSAKLLLEHGANVNIQAGEYGTPLQAASYQEHHELIKLLLQHGADANIQAGKFGTASEMCEITALLFKNDAKYEPSV